MSAKPNSIVPECIALLVCHEVIEDVRSHNKTIVGMFNNIFVNSFPAEHRASVLMSFANGRGKSVVSLRWVNRTADKIVIEAEGPVVFEDAHTVIDFVFEFPNLPIPAPGLYAFEVLSGEKVLMQRKVDVQERQAQ